MRITITPKLSPNLHPLTKESRKRTLILTYEDHTAVGRRFYCR